MNPLNQLVTKDNTAAEAATLLHYMHYIRDDAMV